MHALRMAVTAKIFAGVIAPAPKTTPHTRQRENMPWHFRTRDMLKPPDNEAGIQPESSHAPRPAEHGDDEPARVLGGRAALEFCGATCVCVYGIFDVAFE